MSVSELLAASVALNIILGFWVMRLRQKNAKYRKAIDNIDDIVSALEEKPPPPPNPRQGIEWKIKR